MIAVEIPSPKALSPHLDEREFVATSHRDLWAEQVSAWAESPWLQYEARRFAVDVFEKVRALVGPLRVTSGFRCASLNALVGGRPNSRHVIGLAADVIPIGMSLGEAMDRITEALAAGELTEVDEAILELGWIHIQGATVGAEPRRLTLQTDNGVSFTPYERGAIS